MSSHVLASLSERSNGGQPGRHATNTQLRGPEREGRRQRGGADGLGAAAPGPRRGHLRGPAGPRGHHPGGLQPAARAGGARPGRSHPQRVRAGGARPGRAAAGGHAEPEPADRRDRGHGERAADPQHGPDPALHDRGQRRGGRGHAPQAPARRPAAPAAAAQPAPAPPGRARGAELPQLAGLPGSRNPVPDQEHARGCARLPGAEPRQPGPVLRPAAVPAAVQAAVHDRRVRPLLPDRALLPGRGPAGGPSAGVHPDRHRDVFRGRGGRHAHGRRPGGRPVPERARPGAENAVPASALL